MSVANYNYLLKFILVGDTCTINLLNIFLFRCGQIEYVNAIHTKSIQTRAPNNNRLRVYG